MLFQDILQGIHGTGMGPYVLRIRAYSGQRTLDHLVGDRMRKHDQEIWCPDPASHICAGFAEYFGFTSVSAAHI